MNAAKSEEQARALTVRDPPGGVDHAVPSPRSGDELETITTPNGAQRPPTGFNIWL
jgi:hypothetical protein